MSLNELLKAAMNPEPEEPRRKRKGAITDSIALVACMGGAGCILAYDGEDIESSFDVEPGANLSDHGLDDAPDGLSVWEGKIVNRELADTGEYDSDMVGKFRPLTFDEWDRYRVTQMPWEFES